VDRAWRADEVRAMAIKAAENRNMTVGDWLLRPYSQGPEPLRSQAVYSIYHPYGW
jgi:hypothetical protein